MDETELPLTEHLAELRRRIVWILLAWATAAILCWQYREAIFGALLAPALDALGPDTPLQAIAPTEIFFTYLKCALLAGFVLSTPVFFWNVWAFVAPGLYASEKRFAVPFVVFSTLLFAGGATFGYGLVFPLIFDFFSGFASEFVSSAWTMREVFGLTTRLFIAFGVGFELPVVVFFVAASGLLSTGQLLAGSKYGLLVAFVLGAVLTPPDVVSQILLAAPLFVLYLIGAVAGGFFAKTEEARQPPRALP
ncbi:MAG: twin-arginine translocase subunit TatC [Myxococcales bacterium]|nr:twin-arginine translocase subunit TatC [Myxococcales bacterium]